VTIIVLSLKSLDRQVRDFSAQRESIVNAYEQKLQVKEVENIKLKDLTIQLTKEVDSLKKVKTAIIQIYEEEINHIYDATAYEHAMWLDSVVKKVSSCQIK